MQMKYTKAGCENPATVAKVDVGHSHKLTRPVAAMAGSLSRKIPDAKKAGQDVAGEANQVKITHGKGDAGKQTWKGARSGYTTKSAPEYKGSPGPMNGSGSGMGKEQNVKGKDGKSAPRESKSVAGRS
jgi:hypothetical protein